MMTWRFLILLLVLLSCVQIDLISSCYLHGTDSGVCMPDGVYDYWRLVNMPFCAGSVNYPVCVPKYQPLPASREFPLGRYYNHTIQTKDNWVKQNCMAHTLNRNELEKNRTLKSQRINEYGDPGVIIKRFDHQPNCRLAYKNYFCWINFPRCDPVRDLTLPTCRSACENFFISCKYSRDLWRCGKSKYFNGYSPEEPILANNESIYMRDYFPGQPFRENKYTKATNGAKRGSEIPICTPAIDGGGSRLLLSRPVLYSVTLAAACIIAALY